MVKTKVQDLASELDLPTEQLMALLKDMHVFARGPQSSLEDDQIAAVRVRWEREKRKKKAATPAAPKRRVTKKAVAAEPEAAPAAKATKRRRTAAEVAEVEARLETERQAEAAAAAAAFDLEMPMLEKPEPVEATGGPMPTIEERARALFKDLPPLSAQSAEPAATPPVETPRPAPPLRPVSSSQVVHRAPFIPPRVQRPAPGFETGRAPGRGPRPVFSSSPGSTGGSTAGPSTQRPSRPDGGGGGDASADRPPRPGRSVRMPSLQRAMVAGRARRAARITSTRKRCRRTS